MSLQQSFSRFRKKAKYKLSRIGRKPDKTPAGVGSEGLDRSSLSLPSEPAIEVEDERRGDANVDGGEGDPQLNDSRSILQASAEREPGGSDDNANRREGDQGVPPPHTQLQAGRKSTREGKKVDREGAGQDPSESAVKERAPVPSIPQAGGSGST